MTLVGNPRSTARPGDSPFVELCLRRLPDGLLLNVGAGLGRTRDVTRVINLDVDPDVLRAGRGVAGDALRLPFAPGCFDGALLKDVLEHVPDPVGVLVELARVSREDATIIVTVPRAIPRAVWADPTHRRGFTRTALEWTLRMGGWESLGRIDRIGSIPGAGRVPFLLEHAHELLRVPLLGHRLGTNWLAVARRQPEPRSR